MSLISKDKVIVDLANAYRTVSGTSEKVKIGELADKISALSGSSSDPVIEPIEITENGTYTAPDGVDGYSPVVVNVTSGLAYDMGEFVLDADVKDVKAVPHDLGSIPEFILVWTDDLAGTVNEYGKTINIGFVSMKNITGLKQKLTSAINMTGYTLNLYISKDSAILNSSVPTSTVYCHETYAHLDTDTTFCAHFFGNSQYWRAGITYKYFIAKAWWNTELGGTNA